MLADFLAATATPTPMPAAVHDAYDWWSDIWLPVIVGTGTVGAAAAAVLVAWKSNRIARDSTSAAERATRAAEQSTELAREALAHEREQAKATADRVATDRRARFAERVTARFDAFLQTRNEHSHDSLREIGEIGTLSLEALSSGWPELKLHEWVGWAIKVKLQGEELVAYNRLHGQAVHTMLAAWVTDPGKLQQSLKFWEEKLRREFPPKED